MLLKGVFIIIPNNPLASHSLINFDFLLLPTAHFYKGIILVFFVLATFAVFLSVFLYTLNNTITMFYKLTKIFDKLVCTVEDLSYAS